MLSALGVRGGEVWSLGVGVLAEKLNGEEQILWAGEWAGTPRRCMLWAWPHVKQDSTDSEGHSWSPSQCQGGLREGSAPGGPQSLFT